ncbi:nucleotidyltransferase family protein [Psychrobacillus sp. NEAU-3TGS]|uniref:nucleotidyltransferase family protein n=1 Tax=Psychrobacillus sp. NEAU-3TGS TaxID=2995412 RepID=UPI00249895A5|nr:nucleotidyltransferase family protein [Psychrobacillus sp. NEAU-3TGS]MDI2588483.1 nucleotidyltransferase family protein [Psychrobacillus sp. NEAU-3TGS]
MNIPNEEELIRIIEEDEWMISLLRAARVLNLPDWWICAGFVRSKIWDVLHGFEERTPLTDIDVIYFDPTNIKEDEEKKLEEHLRDLVPSIPWSVKNQARMHVINGFPPYTSATEGIANFPETATALGVKLDDQDKVILTAPHGITDVVHQQVKPTPHFLTTEELNAVYKGRVQKKDWKKTWSKLEIFHS